MQNKKTGIISQNALTGTRNEFYPKVAFDRYNAEDYFLINDGVAILTTESFNDTYVLAEPVDDRWGLDYDILQVEDSLGVYVFSFSALTPVVTTTEPPPPPSERPVEPFLTLTGSLMDYSFRYDYPVNVSNSIYSYSVVPFTNNYIREASDAWYGSSIPSLTGGFYFIGGRTFKTNALDGTNTAWEASSVLGYDPNSKFGVVDKTGITIFGTSKDPTSDEYMITKFDPDGNVVASGAFIVPVGDIPAPYTGYSYNGNGDLILKPNGEYYSPDCFKFTYVDYIPQGTNPPIPVTRYSEPMTASFKVVGNSIMYSGYITNVPENASILGGGMSSVLNWKPIPGTTEEMYYSYYDAIAKVNTNTNQVIWWVEDYSGNDEIFYVLPNKDLVKPTYDSETGEFIISQFSYTDGTTVKTRALDIKDTPLAEGYSTFEWSLSTINFNGYDGLLYLVADCTAVDSEPKIKKTALFKIDQNTFEIISVVDIIGDGVALTTLTPADNATASEVAGIPSYYGYNCITGEGNWWMWYEKRITSPITGYPDSVVAGLIQYISEFDDVRYYNLMDESDPNFIAQYEGFSFINDSVYFPTKNGVHTLVDYLLS